MDFLFSKPGFNCIGDPYKDPPMDPYKHGTSKGRRQFLTAPPKKGQTANAIGYGPLAYKPMYLPGKEPSATPASLKASRRRRADARARPFFVGSSRTTSSRRGAASRASPSS